MASPLAWALVLVDPFPELIQLRTTKENIWGHFGGWMVKLNYIFTGLVGWTSSACASLSTGTGETTKAESRGSKRSGEEGMAASYYIGCIIKLYLSTLSANISHIALGDRFLGKTDLWYGHFYVVVNSVSRSEGYKSHHLQQAILLLHPLRKITSYLFIELQGAAVVF